MASKKRKPVDYHLTTGDDEDLNNNNYNELQQSDSDEEDVDFSKLLESFEREQLLQLLRSAAASHPPTAAAIRKAADADPSQRKLFVHGLGWDTNGDTLRAAFEQFGQIDECRVVFDRNTGRSKGYGFVLFRRRSSAQRALKQPQKLIDGRMTACQLASTGPPQNPPQNHSQNQSHNSQSSNESNAVRKIYVGNVHADLDGQRLRDFFARFGEIEEGPIGFDRVTGKPRGFALFVYRTVEGAQRALEEPNKIFEGHKLFCQIASDRKTSKDAPLPAGSAAFSSQQNALVQDHNFGPGVFGGPSTEMGMPSAIMSQGMMQPNAALFAMLAAAGQNPATFGINPAMLASFNPALAAAMLGAGAGPVMPPAVASGSVQGFGVGSSGFQQNVGFQTPPGYQAPPGFQAPPPVAQSGSAAVGPYQGSSVGQVPPRPSVGPMGGAYGQL